MSAEFNFPDRNLALELVRVTETAAVAASAWVGRGDKDAADGAVRHVRHGGAQGHVRLRGARPGSRPPRSGGGPGSRAPARQRGGRERAPHGPADRRRRLLVATGAAVVHRLPLPGPPGL